MRSKSKHTKVARIQNIWKISSSARRDSTNMRPSTVANSAAMVETVTERKSNHAA